MAALWRFRCYVSGRGIDEIKRWYDEGEPKMGAAFLSRLQTLSQLEAHQWELPYFRWLHGDCRGLGEVRFKANGVQHRPLGFLSGDTFTLLFGAKEKGGKFLPKSACEIAQARKIEIQNAPQYSKELWLALS